MADRPFSTTRPCGVRFRRRVRTRTLVLLGLVVVIVAPFASGRAAGLPDTIDAVRASVVAVGTFRPTGSPRQVFRGTGFVVGDGRLVVTSHHVLPEKGDGGKREQLAVYSGRGGDVRFHAASVAAADPAHDLALLAITTRLPALRLAVEPDVREGTEVAFTGFPLGMVLGLYPVTHRGIVSAVSPVVTPQLRSQVLTGRMIQAMRDPYDVLQLDATAYPGNSGSPVYDRQSGRVVGVINSVLVKSLKEAAIEHPSGITYAIPARFVRKLLERGVDSR